MPQATLIKDGVTNFFIADAFNFSGQLFTQKQNGSFGVKNLTDSMKMEKSILSLSCNGTHNYWLENVGNGKFIKHLLRTKARFAPINAIVCDNEDGHGYMNLLLAGNEYGEEAMTGHYYTYYDCLSQGSQQKTFKPLPPVQSGFIVKRDVKNMLFIRTATSEKLLLVAVNNDWIKVLKGR